MNFKVIEHIATIKEWKTVSIELNIVDWGDGNRKYDIRKWSGKEPLKGISMDKEDLHALYNILGKDLGFSEEETDVPFGVDGVVAFNGEDESPFKDLNENNKQEDKISKVLDYRNVIVYDNFFECEMAKHYFEELNAYVDVYKSDGVKRISVPVKYCRNCNAYYISFAEYQKVTQNGRILCRVVSKKEYNQFIKNRLFVDLDFQSILSIVGYTVSAGAGLTDKCRQEILKRAIESGVFSKNKAINHISFLIKLNEGKVTMQQAVEKWKKDREYLCGDKVNIKIKEFII